MRIAVTGATGFVGRHVVACLLERGHSVVAVSRDTGKAERQAWFGKVRHVACDLHALARAGRSSGADEVVESLAATEAVVHLAWPGLPNYQSSFHVEENLAADRAFLELLVRRGAGHLLVTGTCLEYGMQSGELAEETPAAPTTAYGSAKDALRRFLESLQQERRFALQWVRLFYLFGPGQNPGSLLALLDRAIDDGEPVFNMSGGEQLRDYLPVEEAARRLALLVEHPERQGVVNCCAGRPISVRELVERRITEKGARIALNLGHYPYPDHEPMAFWGNSGKLGGWLTEWSE